MSQRTEDPRSHRDPRVMVGRRSRRGRVEAAPVLAEALVAPPARDADWDAVDQASWESFPASDAPGWIGAPSTGSVREE